MRGRVMAVENVFIGASNELGAFESGVAGAAARRRAGGRRSAACSRSASSACGRSLFPIAARHRPLRGPRGWPPTRSRRGDAGGQRGRWPPRAATSHRLDAAPRRRRLASLSVDECACGGWPGCRPDPLLVPSGDRNGLGPTRRRRTAARAGRAEPPGIGVEVTVSSPAPKVSRRSLGVDLPRHRLG